MSSIAVKNNKFYITTPIYYVNDVPHIGHTYTTIAADVLARYHRMIGDRTFFLTGTDEHGAKIEEKAREASMEPKQFVDEVTAKFQFAWDELNISNDNFIRTTDPAHIKAVQKVLQHLYDKGGIYKGEYKGLYCKGCEQYKNEKDLVNGKCPDHGTKPEKMSEECYMFKMSKYGNQILKKIKSNEFKISPVERRNEILSFYKDGLKDIAFSRKNVKWGIPLPWDKNHTAYVWADAFLNYLTGLGWDGDVETHRNASLQFKNFWPADAHIMAKDILRVHATIWPAMLLALDLALPKQLFVHGYFLIDGKKMSKSIGNVIAPSDLVKKYGVDGARYLLMSATTFGHDGDVGFDKFDEKYNADLANGLGNLVARSITLVEKMESAKISARGGPALGWKMQNDNAKNDKWDGIKFEHNMKTAWNDYLKYLDDILIDKAIGSISIQIKNLDFYITSSKPWELIKNKDERVGTVMYNILERLRHVAWMVWPFMPETAEKIYSQLGLDLNKEMQAKNYKFENVIKWGGLKSGTKIKKGEVLFPRI